MNNQKVLSSISAWRLSAIVIGLRLFRWQPRTRQEDLRRALAKIAQDRDLQARDAAEAVQKAAIQGAYLQLGLVGLVVVALVLAVFAALILYIGFPVQRAVANRLNPPIPKPTLAPTPTLTPEILPTPTHVPIPLAWTFNGHVYKDGTAEGIEGARIQIQSFSNNEWKAGGIAGIGGDGAFTLTYHGPLPLEGTSKFRLVLELPPNWNVVTRVEAPNATWSQVDSRNVEGQFSRPDEAGGVTFYCAVERTFSGEVYFEGENTPASATVQLRHWDPATGAWSAPVASEEIAKSPASSMQVIPVAFKLRHISSSQGVDYQVSIAPSVEGQTLDWVAGIPAARGRVEGSTVRIPGGQVPLDMNGIAFAGPLPIHLGYQLAQFSPPYHPENPDKWVNSDANIESPSEFPYAYRSSNEPLGAWVRWPLWLPPGTGYEVWVGQPSDRNAVIATYELLRRLPNNQEGEAIVSTSSTEIAQCLNDAAAEPEKLAGIYPIDSIRDGGAFWLKIDESKARRNEECTIDEGQVGFFRLPVWYIEVRRGR